MKARTMVKTAEAPTGRPDGAPGTPRRTKVVLRRIEPWSVLKFSLLFYLCVLIIVIFALLITYWVLGLIGVLDSVERLMSTLGFGPQKGTFKLNAVWIFTRVSVIGGIGVVVWSLVNLLLAMLYNLLADVIGGVTVTLSEKR